MARPTVLNREEELLTKYFAFREDMMMRDKGEMCDGKERLIILNFMTWLCKRYTVTSIAGEKQRRSNERKKEM